MKDKMKRVVSLFLMVIMFSTSFTGVIAESMNAVPPESAVSSESGSDATSVSSEETPISEPAWEEEPKSTLPEEAPDVSSEPNSDPATEVDPDDESIPSSEPTSEPTETPGDVVEETDEEPFVPLAIQDETKSIDAAIGDTVEFFLTLNRTDVIVRYQWQKNFTPPEDETLYGTKPEKEKTEDDMFSTGGYQWLIDDVSEAEWLVDHPDIVWQGKELWDEAVEIAGGDTSKVHIPNGAKSLADVTIDGITISSDGVVINDEPEETVMTGWVDIEGETNPSFLHVTNEDDQYTVYRCVVTIEDEKYFEKAAVDANKNAPSEETESEVDKIITDEPIVDDETIIVDSVLIATTVTSNEMRAKIPEKVTAIGAFNAVAQAFAAPRAFAPSVRRDGDYIVGLDKTTMEYITKNTYDNFGCSGAGNAYWTKLNGGTRPDDSNYFSVALTTDGQGKMPILSAWYGKTVYVRFIGSSGAGTAIDIPAYTGVDYQTGQKTVYKNAITVLSVRVPETSSVDFYTQYIQTNQNANTKVLLGNSNGAAKSNSKRVTNLYIFGKILANILKINCNNDII